MEKDMAHSSGEDHPRAKLTKEAVGIIKRRARVRGVTSKYGDKASNDITQVELARVYDVSTRLIASIVNRESWASVKPAKLGTFYMGETKTERSDANYMHAEKVAEAKAKAQRAKAREKAATKRTKLASKKKKKTVQLNK